MKHTFRNILSQEVSGRASRSNSSVNSLLQVEGSTSQEQRMASVMGAPLRGRDYGGLGGEVELNEMWSSEHTFVVLC